MRVSKAPLGAKIDEQQFILEVSPAGLSGDKESGGGNKPPIWLCRHFNYAYALSIVHPPPAREATPLELCVTVVFLLILGVFLMEPVEPFFLGVLRTKYPRKGSNLRPVLNTRVDHSPGPGSDVPSLIFGEGLGNKSQALRRPKGIKKPAQTI